MAEFNANKISKIKGIDPDASYSFAGVDNGTFTVASSKKELKQLMKSDVEVVCNAKKGKLYLNANGEEKGWVERKVGGLIARFKGKPEMSSEQFEGMVEFNAATGDHDQEHSGDTKKQIAA